MKKFIKIFVILLIFVVSLEGFTSCKDNDIEVPPIEKQDQKEVIYNLAVESGYDGTYEEWLEEIKGDNIELSTNETHILWKYVTESAWHELIKLEELMGPKGENGETGLAGQDGQTPEFRVSEGYLEWKYTNESLWNKLYEIKQNEEKKEIVITFVTEYEELEDGQINIINSIEKEIYEGAIKLPEEIDETKYDNWYYYDIYTEEYEIWKFDYYYAQTDMILYGEKLYTVTYLDSNGEVYKEISYRKGENIENINYCDESGVFYGWYFDETFDVMLTLNSQITENVILYPKMIEGFELVCDTYTSNSEIKVDNGDVLKIKKTSSGQMYSHIYSNIKCDKIKGYTKLMIRIKAESSDNILFKLGDNIDQEFVVYCDGTLSTTYFDINTNILNSNNPAIYIFPGIWEAGESEEFEIYSIAFLDYVGTSEEETLNALNYEFYSNDIGAINISNNGKELIVSKNLSGGEFSYCYSLLMGEEIVNYSKLKLTINAPTNQRILIKVNDQVEEWITGTGSTQTYIIDFSSITINSEKYAIYIFPGVESVMQTGEFVITKLEFTN